MMGGGEGGGWRVWSGNIPGVQFSHEMADSACKTSLFMNMNFTPFLRNLFFVFDELKNL
jgi:hypothetical protein